MGKKNFIQNSTRDIRVWGTNLRIYDYGDIGGIDRFTIIPPRYDRKYKVNGEWMCLHSGVDPKGFSGRILLKGYMVNGALGSRISWKQLPVAVQKLANADYPEYAMPVTEG